jgi:hypothetical protein
MLTAALSLHHPDSITWDWVYYYRDSRQREWGLPALLVQAVHKVLGVIAQLRILLIVWDAAACEVQQPPHDCVLVVHIV